MNRAYFIVVFCFGILLSCSNESNIISDNTDSKNLERKFADSVNLELQKILDTTKLDGSILIYDLKKDTYYSNDFEWAKVERLPASTFKIVNSIIGLETGVVENDSTLFKWNGEKRRLKIWEKNLLFSEAYSVSCVPCYQEIAREIGIERMNQYLKKLNYGNSQIADSMIDLFWLEGEFGVSQYQQIDFLRKLQSNTLGIKKHTWDVMRKIMITKESENAVLRGKTGWAIRDEVDNGWYVGYVESGNHVYFVATNVTPKADFNLDFFPDSRLNVTIRALEIFGINL